MILKKLFPSKTQFALTFSYDDGSIHDRRLVEILNARGLKGTFNLNSDRIGPEDGQLSPEEIPALYAGHEVASHTVHHTNLDEVDSVTALRDILDDRAALERLVGVPVRGFAYPCGAVTDEAVAVLRAAGIVHARTVHSTGEFRLPADFLRWNPTCHHADQRLFEIADRFLANIRTQRRWCGQNVFYVWGHSYEFDRKKNWDLIERFGDKMAGNPDIWYATNIEIVDYLAAQRALQSSVDGSILRNPSACSVWVEADGEPLEIPAGATVRR